MRVIALFYSIILVLTILLTNVLAEEPVVTPSSDAKGKPGVSEDSTKTAGEVETTSSSDQTSTPKPEVTPVADYKKLGDRLLKEKKTTEAMEAYKQFIDNGGKNQVIARKLGNHCHKLKQYEEALKYLSMVSGKASQNVFHLIKLAEANYHTKNYKSAIVLYKKLNAKGQYTSNFLLVKTYICTKPAGMRGIHF